MNLQNRLIDLKTAISHIQQARELSGEVLKNSESPFFFIVGSGVSFPPVPLASMITEYCKKEASKRDRGQDVPEKPMELYSYYFKQAFPQAKQRQNYLRGLIEGKPISKANLRLAHLLSEDGFTDLVITPNFDDFLARGLSLFGKPYIVCDHPFAIARMDAARRDDIKIIQVHGSYWFYDCANLSDEIEERAQRTQESNQSMAAYLDAALSGRSPLVLGYSGWEGDVIMSALHRRLKNPLGTNLYWFCYKRANVEELPDWLRNHPNVYFVIPPSTVPQPDDELMNLTNPVSDRRVTEFVLSSQEVLSAFIQAYNLPAPKVTREPLKFFADQLESLLILQNDEEITDDFYLISEVVERVRKAEGLLNQSDREVHADSSKLVDELENKFEIVRDAVRRLNHKEAIDAIEMIYSTKEISLSYEHLEEIRLVLWILSFDVEKAGWQCSLDLYNSLIKTLSILETLQRTPHLLQQQLAETFFNKAHALRQLGQFDQAVSAYEEIDRRYNSSDQLVLQEWVARALINKGVLLGQLRQFQESIGVYEEIRKRYIELSETTLQSRVAKAMFNKGLILQTSGRLEEAITAYEDVEKQYGDSTEATIREWVVKALVNKGFTFGKLKRSDDEVAVYEEIEKRYGSSADGDLQEQVAGALVNKAITLVALRRFADAIITCDEIRKRYSGSPRILVQERVAGAIVNKGIILGQLSRFDEAISAFDDVEKQYGKSLEVILQDWVFKALHNKRFCLMQLGRFDEAMSVSEEIEKRYGGSSEFGI